MIESRLLGRRKATPQSVPDAPGYGSWDGFGGAWEPEARHHYVHAYRDRVWVQRCANLIAKSMTQVPLRAFRSETELESHPILDLAKRPNPRDPALMFVEWSGLWSQVVGEWYWELIPGRGGGIAEAYPLRSHLVRVIPGSDGKVAGYTYDPNNDGNVREFDAADPASGRLKPNEVISGRFASPLDDWYGMPPLRGAKDDIVSEYYAVRYDHRFFRNSARPDVVVSFKGSLSREDRSANRKAWEDFKGVDQAHKAAILDNEGRVQTVTQSQKDVEYLEGRRLAREGECAAFGVPPVLVGDLTRATYSNYKESETIFWKSTMLPLLEFFATWMNFVVVPFFDGVDRVDFDTSMIQALQESENDKVERVVKAISGGAMTPARGMEEIGEEPIEEPEAQRIYLPFSLTPIAGEGLAEERAEKQERADAIADAIRGAQGNGNGGPPADDEEPVANGNKPAKSKAKDATGYVDQRDKLIERYTEEVTRQVAAVVRDAGKEVQAIVAGKSKIAELERALEQYGWGELGVKLEGIIGSMHFAVWGEASLATESILGLEVGLGDDAPQVQTLLRELANRPDGIKTVEGRIKEDVLEEVRFGISKGVPNRGIAEGGQFGVGPPGDRDAEQVTIKGVKGVFEEYQTWQAERIVRTEAVNAYNRGSALVMREAGVEYVDIVDGMEDANCADANGARWTLDEFESNPYEHPNCTRVGLPVIEVPKSRTDITLPIVLPAPKEQPAPVVNYTPPPVEIPPTVVNVHPVVGEKARRLVYEDGKLVGSEPVED